MASSSAAAAAATPASEQTAPPPSPGEELRGLRIQPPPTPPPHDDDNHHDAAAASAAAAAAATSFGTTTALPFPNTTTSTTTTKRLRSIAQYESFHPQALACSSKGDEAAASAADQQTSSSSLGAIAGSDGVAIFRVEQPHVPLMILSHAYGKTSSSTVTSLAFSNSLSLASARGKGILVWDVSGQSLSPLQGRLGGFVKENSDTADNITSLTWTRSSSSFQPWLAATTVSSACLWDMRQPNNNTFRPSLRFATRGSQGLSLSSGFSDAMYVQIACSHRHECAILDALGTVRIYDTRMTDRLTRMSTGSLYQFQACQHAGVGLSYLPTTTTKENCWVTWGLDKPMSDAVVKIWMSNSSNSYSADASSSLADDSWYLADASPDRPHSRKSTASSMKSGEKGYQQVGECTTPHLACARVCPQPIEDSIVTVGLDPSGKGWQAELWSIDLTSSAAAATSALQRKATFQGGKDIEVSLRNIVGKDHAIRPLRASELAFTMTSDHEGGQSGSGAELLLCCMTENGLVTTHAIPEAISADQAGQKESSIIPPKPTLGDSVYRKPTKLFPAESEVAINDAAKPWADAPTATVPGNFAVERGFAPDSHDNILTSGGAVVQNRTGMEGGVLPFDMDIPVAYSSLPAVGRNDVISPNSVSKGSSGEDKEQVENAVRDAAALMERIETDRIPCPRLCGAVFSSGVGGLAAFHNGDVKRMWHWWERTHPDRLAAVPGLIGESSPSYTDISEATKNAETGSTPGLLPVIRQSTCPRTLKDLLDMRGAAKEAQWGEQEESEPSSTGFPAIGSKFFEDDSDGSSESAEQAEETGDVSDSKDRNLYDSYFGDFHRSLNEPVGQEPSAISEKKASGDFLGATDGAASDVLTPVVKVSHEHDRLALSGQSPELAEVLKLGDFISQSISNAVLGEEKLTKEEAISATEDLGLQCPLTPESPKRVLPSYRSLLPASPLSKDPAQGYVYRDDEQGVHGGEYSVRPNMQESMVFLRKLFTHQQQEGGNTSLMSPPDGPMLPNGIQFGDSENDKPRRTRKQHKEHRRPGVYARRVSTEVDPMDAMLKIEEVCTHNVEMCRLLGEHEKERTWVLIAKVVRSKIEEKRCRSNAWGYGGEAMGVSLVNNLLRYYELVGDVQMLSTIVCVLRSDRQTSGKENEKRRSSSFLPKDQLGRYDSYIRRYADLLYGWGLLTVRTELNKHLLRVVAPMESCENGSTGTLNEIDQSSGVAVSFKCPRCSSSTEAGTNYCSVCRNFAFRCAICDNAVRGLFTVCDSCGHGGHVSHLQVWFQDHDECPSGCGCNCRQASSTFLQRDVEMNVQAQPNMMQHSANAQPITFIP